MTDPCVGLSIVDRIFNNVVFPEPLGPMIAIKSFLFTFKSNPFKTLVLNPFVP